jgi:hypothetical protein
MDFALVKNFVHKKSFAAFAPFARRFFINRIPTGFKSFSPALTRSGYAGLSSQKFYNPERVASFVANQFNPFRVVAIMFIDPA